MKTWKYYIQVNGDGVSILGTPSLKYQTKCKRRFRNQLQKESLWRAATSARS